MTIKKYKNILITGASSGIGKQMAIDYAEPGVNLYLSGRNEKRLQETMSFCKEKGAEVFTRIIDVRDREAMKEWVLSCNKENNLDLVIANAGISAGTFGGTEPDEQVYEIYNTNIFGVLNTIEPIIPEMIKRKSGQIAIISSMSSFIGMASCPAYSSSKACMTAYGEGLRGYLKYHGIGVSVVCPGFIKTPLTDKNKFIMPLIMSPERASKKIIKGISKNKGMIAFPLIFYILLKITRLLPFPIVNYLFSKLPKK